MTKLPLLHKITAPSGQSSFLFGTMHIRDDRVYQFCQDVYPLIRAADVYIGEMDFTSPPVPPSMVPEYDMRQQFPPDVYAKIRHQILKSFQLDIDRFGHLHPMMILSAISNSVLVADHSVSLDEHLWNRAKEYQRQLSGLETIQEQVALLHAVDPIPLYRQIRKLSANPRSVRRFTSRALGYYVTGEIHQLYQMTRSSMHELKKHIIDDRNRIMASRITQLDPSLRYFITVGAGHLSGKAGLITLLRHSGWKVRPVRLTAL